MKFRYWILLIAIAAVIISGNVLAMGSCILDKESYNSGETAIFICACTSPQEEGADGFLVWRNTTGDITQNTSINSGNCRTSFFDDTRTFPNGFATAGNVTFETSNIEWGDADDIINDSYNVTLPGVFDCAITDFVTASAGVFQVGEESGMAFRVRNALTDAPLVNSQCMVQLVDVDLISLVTRPMETSPKDFRSSASGGRVSFSHDLDEKFWQTNTTYLVRANCHCIDDSNVPGQACYNENLGTNAGFQTCSASTVFTTDFVDERLQETNDRSGGFAVVFFILFGTTLFLALPFIIKDFSRLRWLDLLLKRLSIVMGLTLMLMNTGTVLEIADASGLGVLGELVIYFRIFSIGVYLLLFYTVWKTFVDFIQMHHVNELTKRGLLDE